MESILMEMKQEWKQKTWRDLNWWWIPGFWQRKINKSTNVPKIGCFGSGKVLRFELWSAFALDLLVDYMYFIFSLCRQWRDPGVYWHPLHEGLYSYPCHLQMPVVPPASHPQGPSALSGCVILSDSFSWSWWKWRSSDRMERDGIFCG